MNESKPGETPNQAKTALKKIMKLIKIYKYSDQIRKRQMATWTGGEDSEIRSHKEVH